MSAAPAHSDRGLLAVAEAVRRNFGFMPPTVRWSDFERTAREAADRFCAGQLDELASRVNAHDATVTEPLLTHFSIPESYFFRLAAHFDLFRAVARATDPQRGLRVWSAGCARGEEAYSLSICALEELGERAANVSIAGTDINALHLAEARSACYRPWSLRGLPQETRASWFTDEPSRGRYRLRDEARTNVRFLQHNMTAPLAPFPPGSIDVVFCRNALVYLTEEGRAKALTQFASVLSKDGLLVTAPSDGVVAAAGFVAERIFGLSVLRRRDQAAAQTRASAERPAPVKVRSATERSAAAQALREREPSPPGPAEHASRVRSSAVDGADAAAERDSQALLDRAARLADLGQLREARDALASGRGSGSDPRLWVLSTLVLLELGENQQALAAARQATSDAPESPEAWFALAMSSHRAGAVTDSAAAIERALTLLLRQPADQKMPALGHATAREAVQTLRSLRRARGSRRRS